MNKTPEQVGAEIDMLDAIGSAMESGLNRLRTPDDRLEYLVVIWRADRPEQSNMIASVPHANVATVMRHAADKIDAGDGIQFDAPGLPEG